MEEQPKKKLSWKEVVLTLPFFAAFVWFITLVATPRQAQIQLQLSPGPFNALVTVLFVFILVYGSLLFYIFRALHKEQMIEHTLERKVTRLSHPVKRKHHKRK